MNKIRVAVIGGSITGSSCFILLSRLKHLSVVVFEKRNQNQLKNHGYGLGFPNNLLNTMKGIDLIDENFSSINIKNREHYFYKKNDDSESFIFNQKTNMSTLNWELLYSQLSSRAEVQYEHTLTKFERVGHQVRLFFSNGQIDEFDYVIFCDGVHSLGRQLLFSELFPSKLGYIAWRGKFELEKYSIIGRLLEKQLIYTCDIGLGFFYLIPSVEKGKYTINTLIYEKCSNHHPYSIMQVQSGDYKNEIDKRLGDYYKNLVNNFPPFARNVFLMIKKPFIQSVQEFMAPKFYDKNLILAGDASCVLSPVTGSGASNGILDAIDLCDVFKSCHIEDIDAQLNRWNLKKRTKLDGLMCLGKKLGDFYIMNSPDWTRTSAENIEKIWNAIVKPHDWYIKEKIKK